MPSNGDLDPRWYARLFDRLGAGYENLDFTKGTDQEVDFLFEELGLQPMERVLDVGCGTGRHAVALAERGLTVTGLDLSLRLLELALARAKEHSVLVNFRHDDAREIAPSASFDAALSLCEGAFGLLEDDEQNRRVLASMRRTLRAGGRLALNALNRLHREAHREDYPGYDPDTGWTERSETFDLEFGGRTLVHYRDRAFHPREIADEMTRAGFAVRSIYGCRCGDFGRHPPDASMSELLVIADVAG